LGIDAVLVSGWLRWQEKVVKTQEEEEEEILSNHETQDKLTGENISLGTNVRSAKRLNGSSAHSSVHSSPQPPGRKQASRQSAQTPPQKIPARTEQLPNLSRSQPQTGLNAYPPTPSNFGPGTLTHPKSAVNGVHYSENVQQQMYFTEPKITEWEYKIVRAHSDLFRNPTNFMRLCEEESQAGWILLEKLDDRRVRFKRSVEIKDKIDVEQLSFDPYRCHYGHSNGAMNLLGAIAAVTAMVLPAYLGYTLVSHTLQESTHKKSQTQAPVELINPTFQLPQIP
jgi:hypothetical protein